MTHGRTYPNRQILAAAAAAGLRSRGGSWLNSMARDQERTSLMEQRRAGVAMPDQTRETREDVPGADADASACVQGGMSR